MEVDNKCLKHDTPAVILADILAVMGKKRKQIKCLMELIYRILHLNTGSKPSFIQYKKICKKHTRFWKHNLHNQIPYQDLGKTRCILTKMSKAYKVANGLKRAKPIMSANPSEARARVFHLYKAWYKQIPQMGNFFKNLF